MSEKESARKKIHVVSVETIKGRKRTPLKHRLLMFFLSLLAKLPFPLSRKIGRGMGWLSYYFSRKQKNFIKTNLKHCLVETTQPREDLLKKVMLASGQLVAELAITWLWQPKKIQQLPINVEGFEWLEKAYAKQKGVMILTPHLGNWELFFPFLVDQFPLAAMYKPARMQKLDSLIKKQRIENGGEMFPANGKGIRQMLRALKQGKVTFMLPDQQPTENAGVFVPFFGQPAWTMTLPGKLYQRSQCELIFACALQTDQGFKIIFQPAEDINISMNSEQLAKAINQRLQKMIMLAPEQYQWSYKRFYYQPDGKPQIYV